MCLSFFFHFLLPGEDRQQPVLLLVTKDLSDILAETQREAILIRACPEDRRSESLCREKQQRGWANKWRSHLWKTKTSKQNATNTRKRVQTGIYYKLLKKKKWTHLNQYRIKSVKLLGLDLVSSSSRGCNQVKVNSESTPKHLFWLFCTRFGYGYCQCHYW